VMNGAALAQTTGSVNPNPSPAEPSASVDVPPGGCMPIGLTAAGEIVFPIQCKEFIERERGKAVEQKPVATEQAATTPSRESAAPANKPENSKPENSKLENGESEISKSEISKPDTSKPEISKLENSKPENSESEISKPETSKPPEEVVETSATPKRLDREPRQRLKQETSNSNGSYGCQHYRTYDRESATYMSYDGHRRACR
jgi:hypothetical protein